MGHKAKKLTEFGLGIVCLILIAFIVVDAFAAGHRIIHLRNFFTRPTLGSRTWQIAGTEADTSEMVFTGGTMTLSFWASDSSGLDSVGLRLVYDVLGVNNAWDSVKTKLISSDTTGQWMLTDEAIPSNKIGRLRAYGVSGNRVLGTGSQLMLDLDIYE